MSFDKDAGPPLFPGTDPEAAGGAKPGDGPDETGASVKSLAVVRLGGGRPRPGTQDVIREAPLTLFVNDQEIVTLLSIPTERVVLAIGFLVSEGWVRSREEIREVQEDADTGVVRIRLSELPPIAERFWEKRLIGSGCGKATSFTRVMDAMQCRPVTSSLRVSVEQILAWMKETLQQAPLYGRTRGTHAVSLYGQEGQILFEQDIGRHNALDRVLGKCFLRGQDATETVLLTTGRLSSEMIVKAARLGVPILVSRSSTTTLAIELAERLNLTILGCIRAGRLSLYTHPDRIRTDP